MTERISVLGSLVGSAIRVFMRVAFSFEPLAPTAITLYMNQQLSRYKEGGTISHYKTHTKRLGKYHYKIEISLDLTGRQAVHLLANVFPKLLSRYGRWLHD